MLVDVQGGQRRNIDFELVLRRNSLRRLRIQTVDAFDDQNVIGAHGNRRILVASLSGLEIKGRKLHLFSV